jgi:hypothetical protein
MKERIIFSLVIFTLTVMHVWGILGLVAFLFWELPPLPVLLFFVRVSVVLGIMFAALAYRDYHDLV